MGIITPFQNSVASTHMSSEALMAFNQLLQEVEDRLILGGYDASYIIGPLSTEQDKAMLFVKYNDRRDGETYKLQCDKEFHLGSDLSGVLKVKIAPQGTFRFWRGVSVPLEANPNSQQPCCTESSVSHAVEQMVSYIHQDIDLVVRGKIDYTISHP